jgi:hypothetical protein
MLTKAVAKETFLAKVNAKYKRRKQRRTLPLLKLVKGKESKLDRVQSYETDENKAGQTLTADRRISGKSSNVRESVRYSNMFNIEDLLSLSPKT